MNKNIVGCRIKVIKTGLFCEIAIGWNYGSIPYVWSRLENKMARLEIPKNGQWALIDRPQYDGTSITIMPQSPIRKEPDGGEVFTTIVDLLALPKDFIENAKCGNYASGKGVWIRTLEAVDYELFSPCA